MLCPLREYSKLRVWYIFAFEHKGEMMNKIKPLGSSFPVFLILYSLANNN